MSQIAINKVSPAEPASMSLLQDVENAFERIKQRAFELFDQRGRVSGKELDDWLAAERQLVLAPPSELVEAEGNFEIRTEAPGFTADQIKVSIMEDCIIIEGKRESYAQRDEGKIHFSELSYRDLLRRFWMPGQIDPDRAYASLQDGVLKIIARKSPTVHSKLVTDQSDSKREKKSVAA